MNTALVTALFALALAGPQQTAPPPAAPANPASPANPAAAPATPPKQAARPGTPVEPPFVQSVGAGVRRASESADAKPTPYIAGVNQWVVEQGSSWKLFADKIKPGDEILFRPMFHIPQDFGSLQGTAERPIVIRSFGPQPGIIACEQFGFRFHRAKHIVVENLVFLNAVDAAIQYDGSPVEGQPADSELGKPMPAGWNSEFLVRFCTIAGTRSSPEHDAIRINDANSVRLDSLRIEGWNDNALELNACGRVLVRGLMMVPMEKYVQRRGMSVLGASSDISINASSFNKGIGTGVWFGTPGAPNANGVTEVRPAERVRIDRCIFDRVGTPIVLANVRDATVSRVTIVDPWRSLYAVTDDAGIVERVLFEKVLATWVPGSIQHFSPHPDRIPPSAITLGDNLWYSAELPMAFEAIGAPFGFESSGQLHTTDPKLDLTNMRPQSMEGVRYGALSIAAVTQGTPNFGPAGPTEGGEKAPPAKPAPNPEKPAQTKE